MRSDHSDTGDRRKRRSEAVHCEELDQDQSRDHKS
jgi:hypothetical protein